MTDVFSKEKRSEVMSHIRGRDTKPEMIVRRFLFSKGFRYRLHSKGLPGHPDIVLKKYRTVIFVNGCFWHGHDCKYGHLPKSNTQYWGPKISSNMERDKKNQKALEESGWRVIRLWECELKKGKVEYLEKLSGTLSV